MPLTQDVVLRIALMERSRVLAVIASITGDWAEAEDLLQETTLLAVQRSAEMLSESHLRGWLRLTARHKALKANERRRERPAFDAELVDLMEDAWQAQADLAPVAIAERLEGCVAKLGPTARRIVELKYTQGLDGAGIAQALGCGVRSVYTSLSRIHRALAQCLAGKQTAENV